MPEITWKKGTRLTTIEPDANVVYVEIEKIREKHGGQLEPQFIVDAARSKRHRLHKFFEWDDTVAAEAYRKTQAAHLIRSIEIEYEEAPDKSTRVYETTWKKDRKGKAYVSTEEIMKDPEARSELLQRALGELLAVRRKYSTLQELAIVFRSIDEVLETIKV